MPNFLSGTDETFLAQLQDAQRQTDLSLNSTYPTDYQEGVVSGITGIQSDLDMAPSANKSARMTVQSSIVSGGTVPWGHAQDFVHGTNDIFWQALQGNAPDASVVIPGVDIASTSSPNGLASVTANKFDALKPLVPCVAYLTRNDSAVGPVISTIVVVTDVAADGLTCTIGAGTAGADFGLTLTDVAAGDGVTLTTARRYRNGVEQHWLQCERGHVGGTSFDVAYGCVVETANLNTSASAVPTVDFAGNGLSTESANATFGSGVNLPPANTEPYQSACDVMFFGVNGQYSDYLAVTPTREWTFDTVNFSWARTQTPVPSQGLVTHYESVIGRSVLTGQFMLGKHPDIAPITAIQKAKALTGHLYALQHPSGVGTTYNLAGVWAPSIKMSTAANADGANDTVETRDYAWTANEKVYKVNESGTEANRYRTHDVFFFDGIEITEAP